MYSPLAWQRTHNIWGLEDQEHKALTAFFLHLVDGSDRSVEQNIMRLLAGVVIKRPSVAWPTSYLGLDTLHILLKKQRIIGSRQLIFTHFQHHKIRGWWMSNQLFYEDTSLYVGDTSARTIYGTLWDYCSWGVSNFCLKNLPLPPKNKQTKNKSKDFIQSDKD